MSARVAILVFPGTNSEDETLRACLDVGLDAQLVHWTRKPSDLRAFDAYILSGGFAYEDRVRAGAIAAHHPLIDAVIEGAGQDKLVLGICNGAQVLLETGLVPGTGPVRRPTAAFAPNRPAHFICRHTYVKLNIPPARCRITAGLAPGALIPTWIAHGEGRLMGSGAELDALDRNGHIAFVYADEDGTPLAAAPNGSALNAAALTNRAGNVLAIMPHPERDGWTFNHRDGPVRAAARGNAAAMLAPSGGTVLFASLAAGLRT